MELKLATWTKLAGQRTLQAPPISTLNAWFPGIQGNAWLFTWGLGTQTHVPGLMQQALVPTEPSSQHCSCSSLNDSK